MNRCFQSNSNYEQFAEERFWSKVFKTDGCWIWNGSYRGPGYGRFEYRGRTISATHFVLNKGALPKGVFACHHCDNPRCVKPDHLFLGNHKENMQDCARKGRGSGKINIALARKRITIEGLQNGEKSWHAKLKESDVISIITTPRREVSDRKFARNLGVSPATIADIRGRRTWKHILIP